MEIIYHKNEQNGQDWELINDYLCSEDLPNVEIGLLALEQTPRATHYAEVGLILTQQFGQEQHQMRARVLLNTYLDRKKLTAGMQLMQIFENDAPNRIEWRAFAPQLQLFEQEGNLYAHYILNKSHYLRQIAILAHNLLTYKRLLDKCWAYANLVLAKNAQDLRARICWVELLIGYYFSKGEKGEEKSVFKQIMPQLYQKYPQLRAIISYHLGIFYTQFEPSRLDALYWLEICEKSGIIMPHYGQILELIQRWKANT